MCETKTCDACVRQKIAIETEIDLHNILAHFENFKDIVKTKKKNEPITTFGDYMKEHSKKETK